MSRSRSWPVPGTRSSSECTTSEFERLKDAQDTHVLAGAAADGSYTDEQKRSIPAYGGLAGGGGMAGLGPAPATGGMGVGGLSAMGRGPARQAIVTDYPVPAGEIQLSSGQPVQATDGAIGRVRGLAVDPGDHHVTHVLLDEGHLWGKKRVAIPFSAVTSVDDGVQLNLAKDQVRDLPAIDVPDWAMTGTRTASARAQVRSDYSSSSSSQSVVRATALRHLR